MIEKPNPEDKELSLSKEAKRLTKEGVLIALTITQITVIFILATLADIAVLKVIIWSFGDSINQNLFAAKVLEGIEYLSGLGTTIAYIFYIIRTLFRDAREALKEIKPSGDKKRNQL